MISPIISQGAVVFWETELLAVILGPGWPEGGGLGPPLLPTAAMLSLRACPSALGLVVACRPAALWIRSASWAKLAAAATWPIRMGSGITRVEPNLVGRRPPMCRCSRATCLLTVLLRVNVRGQYGQDTRMPWCRCRIWARKFVS